jgi:hypothetical protein
VKIGAVGKSSAMDLTTTSAPPELVSQSVTRATFKFFSFIGSFFCIFY